MKKIVLATSNKHKLKEYKELLTDYEIITLDDIGYKDEIEEDGTSFEENAFIKVKAIHDFLKNKKLSYMVIGEDSGLCVESLDGAPGIYSAKYASEHGNNRKNRDKLQQELSGKDRKAYFNCVIALMYPDGEYKYFNGKTYGIISKEELGNKEFGYDCIFYSDELNKTFGEATEEEKNSVSHRGRAIKELLKNI